jgi:hypothetical protein
VVEPSCIDPIFTLFMVFPIKGFKTFLYFNYFYCPDNASSNILMICQFLFIIVLLTQVKISHACQQDVFAIATGLIVASLSNTVILSSCYKVLNSLELLQGFRLLLTNC